jgi:hypothetical protein
MDLLISMLTQFWNTLAPTTWFMVLGLLISLSLLKKTLL